MWKIALPSKPSCETILITGRGGTSTELGTFWPVYLNTGYKDMTHYWPLLKLGNIDPAFLGILCVTEFRVTQIFEKLIS